MIPGPSYKGNSIDTVNRPVARSAGGTIQRGRIHPAAPALTEPFSESVVYRRLPPVGLLPDFLRVALGEPNPSTVYGRSPHPGHGLRTGKQASRREWPLSALRRRHTLSGWALPKPASGV